MAQVPIFESDLLRKKKDFQVISLCVRQDPY
jgi:hypothetical protein